jgi:O-acetyl-ADP-ribose deacetylase (regulator of RNase III)
MSNIRKEVLLHQKTAFQITQGDITLEDLDAIVNAANSQLQHGAGVAGAILRRGGPQVQIESDEWVNQHGPVSHEAPAYTHAGELPCRYIIHAVGPVWGSGDEETKLATAVRGCLALAEKLQLKSLAIPAISTGIYGYPKTLAARVIINSIQDYFVSKPGARIELIRLVVFDTETLTAFMETWDKIFPTPDNTN